ncbi:filamentous hemagglutinin N-terminal domain-containing protein, partial [Psittacicella gerlachiana]
MNRIYRLKLNDQGRLVVVSELCTHAGKTTGTVTDLQTTDVLASALAEDPFTLAKNARQALKAPRPFASKFCRLVKTAGRALGMSATFALTLMGSMSISANAQAVAGDPSVIIGKAQIDVNGLVTNITTSTDKTVINWQKFNIGVDEIYNFIQNSANSAVLNRVLGGEVSQILGTLKSNGQVFIVNPAGIVFGSNATVDVQSLVASTLDISNEDFVKGNLKFSATDEQKIASILNQGLISVGKDGHLSLIGGQVYNTGVLKAVDGQIFLLAGQSITISDLTNPQIVYTIKAGNDVVNLGEIFNGKKGLFLGNRVLNQGKIVANVSANGSVELRGLDSGSGTYTPAFNSENGGTISVTATGEDKGIVINNGSIVAHQVAVNGDSIYLLDNSSIEAQANGNTAGTIEIGGLSQVAGVADLVNNTSVQKASTLVVTKGAKLTAQGTETDSGKILAYANVAYFAGDWTTTSNNGVVETSGAHVFFSDDFNVSTNGGAWLLDPLDICITNSSVLNYSYRDIAKESYAYNYVEDSTGLSATINHTIYEALNSAYSNAGTSDTVYRLNITDSFVNKRLQTNYVTLYTPDGNITFTNASINSNTGYELRVFTKIGNITLENTTINLTNKDSTNYATAYFVAGRSININNSNITANQTYDAGQYINISGSTLTGAISSKISPTIVDDWKATFSTVQLGGSFNFTEDISYYKPIIINDSGVDTSIIQKEVEAQDTAEVDPSEVTISRTATGVTSIIKRIQISNTTFNINNANASFTTNGTIGLDNVTVNGHSDLSSLTLNKDTQDLVIKEASQSNFIINANSGAQIEGKITASDALIKIVSNSSNESVAAVSFAAGTHVTTEKNGLVHIVANGTNGAMALAYLSKSEYHQTYSNGTAVNEHLDDTLNFSGRTYIQASVENQGSAIAPIGDFSNAQLNVDNGTLVFLYYNSDANNSVSGISFKDLNVSNNSTLWTFNLDQNGKTTNSTEHGNRISVSGNISVTNHSSLVLNSRGGVELNGENYDYIPSEDEDEYGDPIMDVVLTNANFTVDSTSNYSSYTPNFTSSNYKFNVSGKVNLGGYTVNSTYNATFIDSNGSLKNFDFDNAGNFNFTLINSNLSDLTINKSFGQRLVLDFMNTSLSNSSIALNSRDSGDAFVIFDTVTFDNTSLNISAGRALLGNPYAYGEPELTLNNNSQLNLVTGEATKDGFRNFGSIAVGNFSIASDASNNTLNLSTKTLVFSGSAGSTINVALQNYTAADILINSSYTFIAHNSASTYVNPRVAGVGDNEQKTSGVYFTAYNISQNGKVTVDADVFDYHATNNLAINNTFSAQGQVYFGDTRAKNNASGTGDGLDTYKDYTVNVNGSIAVTGNLTLRNNVSIANESSVTVSENLTSDSNLYNNGTLITKNLSANFYRQENGLLSVTGNTSINHNFTVLGGVIDVANILADNITLRNGTYIFHNLFYNKTLTISGNANVSADVVYGDNVSVTGSNLTAGHNLSVNNLTVNNAKVVSKDITNVSKNLSLQNASTLEAGNLNLIDNFVLENQSTISAVNLNATNLTVTNSANLAVSNNFNAGAGLTVNQSASVTVNGTLTATKATVDNANLALTGTNDASVTELSLSNNANATLAQVTGVNLSANDSKITLGTVVAQGDLNLSNVTISPLEHTESKLSTTGKLNLTNGSKVEVGTLEAKEVTLVNSTAQVAQVTADNFSLINTSGNFNQVNVNSASVTQSKDLSITNLAVANTANFTNTSATVTNLQAQDLNLSDKARLTAGNVSVTNNLTVNASTFTVDKVEVSKEANISAESTVKVNQNFSAKDLVVTNASLEASQVKAEQAGFTSANVTITSLEVTKDLNLVNSTAKLEQVAADNLTLSETKLRSDGEVRASNLTVTNASSLTAHNVTVTQQATFANQAQAQVSGNLNASNLLVTQANINASNVEIAKANLVASNATFIQGQVGDLKVDGGNFNVALNLEVTHNATFGNQAQVVLAGGATVGEQFKVNNSSVVVTQVKAEQIILDNQAQVTSAFVTAEKDLEVNASSVKAQSVEATNVNLTQNSKLEVAELTASNNITLADSELNVTKEFTAGNASFSNAQVTAKDLVVSGNLALNQTQANLSGNLSAGNLAVTNNSNLKVTHNLTVTGETSISQQTNVTVGEQAQVHNLTVTQANLSASELNVAGNVSVDKANVTTHNDLTALNLQANNASINVTKDVTVTNNLSLDNSSLVANNVTSANLTAVCSSLNVQNKLTVSDTLALSNSAIVVNGTLQAQTVESQNSAITSENVSATNFTSTNGNISVAKDFTAENLAVSKGNLQADSVDVSGNVTLTQANLTATSLNAENFTASTAKVNVTAIKVEDTANFTNVTVTASTLEATNLEAEQSKVKATTITVSENITINNSEVKAESLSSSNISATNSNVEAQQVAVQDTASLNNTSVTATNVEVANLEATDAKLTANNLSVSANASLTNSAVKVTNVTATNLEVSGSKVEATNITATEASFSNANVSTNTLVANNLTTTGSNLTATDVAVSDTAKLTDSNVTVTNVTATNLEVSGSKVEATNITAGQASFTETNVSANSLVANNLTTTASNLTATDVAVSENAKFTDSEVKVTNVTAANLEVNQGDLEATNISAGQASFSNANVSANSLVANNLTTTASNLTATDVAVSENAKLTDSAVKVTNVTAANLEVNQGSLEAANISAGQASF